MRSYVRVAAMLTLCLSASIAVAAGPSAPAAAAKEASDQPAKKLKVLFTYGGHVFDEPGFYAMLDSFTDIAYDKAKLPDDAKLLRPGLEEKYDVLLRYDLWTESTPEEEQQFKALLQRGMGMVVLHHCLGSHQSKKSDRIWEEWPQIAGGAYFRRPTTYAGVQYPKVAWGHDETMPIRVVDHDHPITRGVSDFTIVDEYYGPFYYIAPTAHALLETNDPKNNRQVAWVNEFGKSRIFTLQLGHDAQAWNHPMYRKLLDQGMHWVAR